MTTVDLVDLTLMRIHGAAIGPLGAHWSAGSRLLIRSVETSEGAALFRMIAGLLSPTYGAVLVDGRDVRRNRTDCIRSMGVLFETPLWHAGATLRENVSRLGGRHFSFDQCYADDLAAEVGIAGSWNAAAGMRSPVVSKLANIVLAASHHPDMLLLENPFSHLNEARREQLGRTLDEIHRYEDTTIVIAQADGTVPVSFPVERLVLRDGLLERDADRSETESEAIR